MLHAAILGSKREVIKLKIVRAHLWVCSNPVQRRSAEGGNVARTEGQWSTEGDANGDLQPKP